MFRLHMCTVEGIRHCVIWCRITASESATSTDNVAIEGFIGKATHKTLN